LPSPLRNVSDTARWAAIYRADETDRRDALFRDPFARKLAGARGEEIRRLFRKRDRVAWPWVTRTVLFDRAITRLIGSGVDVIVNLAAGLDARPYRMALPPTLRWIEVDLPGIIDYKTEVLASDQPVCRLERVKADLADHAVRRDLMAKLGAVAKDALVLTEGLLIYLSPEEVRSFSADVAAVPRCRHWLLDMVSPGLLTRLQRGIGRQLDQAGAPLRFGPADGPAFFAAEGWRATDVQSLVKNAARIGRLPFAMRPISWLPEPPQPGKRPWGGVVLLERA
jgi:methyltransferase (TIGR00027 family)